MKNKGVKKSRDFTLTLSDGIVDPYLKVLGSPITQHNLTVFLKIIPQIVAISLIPRFYYSIIFILLFFGPTIYVHSYQSVYVSGGTKSQMVDIRRGYSQANFSKGFLKSVDIENIF